MMKFTLLAIVLLAVTGVHSKGCGVGLIGGGGCGGYAGGIAVAAAAPAVVNTAPYVRRVVAAGIRPMDIEQPVITQRVASVVRTVVAQPVARTVVAAPVATAVVAQPAIATGIVGGVVATGYRDYRSNCGALVSAGYCGRTSIYNSCRSSCAAFYKKK